MRGAIFGFFTVRQVFELRFDLLHRKVFLGYSGHQEVSFRAIVRSRVQLERDIDFCSPVLKSRGHNSYDRIGDIV